MAGKKTIFYILGVYTFFLRSLHSRDENVATNTSNVPAPLATSTNVASAVHQYFLNSHYEKVATITVTVAYVVRSF